MEWLSAVPDLTGVAGVVFVALLVTSGKLVWHTQCQKESARADRWEGIALRALGVAEKVTQAVEAVAEPSEGK